MELSAEQKDKILKDIAQECYWDYDIEISDLIRILKSDNTREQKNLFSKIIYNAKDKLLSLKIFTTDQLKDFFSDFEVTYNHKYIMKHCLVLRALLLNEKVHIKGLEWQNK